MMDIRRAFVAFAAVALVAGTTPIAFAQDEPAAPVEESAAPEESAAAESLIADGELVSIDADAKTLTVRAADGSEMQFSYSDATEIAGAADEAGLATETGSQVTVHYTSDGDVNTASKIEVRAAEE